MCPWCSSSSTPDGYHVSATKLLTCLDEHRATCDTVRLSGGEPAMHPDIVSIARHAHELNYKTILLTCGYDNTNRLPHFVDEHVLHVVDNAEYWVEFYLENSRRVSLHAVLVENNEYNILEALRLGFEHGIPVRLLTLQKQGRGAKCKPLNLVSWTGDKGCNLQDKITISHDGKVTTCSALKYKNTCNMECSKT